MRGLAHNLILSLLLLPVLFLNACSDLDYYLHTANGHMEIMADRKAIPDLLQDEKTSPELREKLREIAWIRHFASERLALPENGSYRSYVELDRPYVVWNVVATPELSLEPLVWCFPFAGCISYRGYFDLDKARQFVRVLKDDGYDTIISGIPAYSTLNWFDDPALSTFSSWPTSSIARLMFHELAHQQLYVPDDSAFNESFATTVELAGVDLWLDRFGSPADKQEYRLRLEREHAFLNLTAETREQLAMAYASDMSDAEKRQRKTDIFDDLRLRYADLKMSWDGYTGYDRWFETLNNAKFASVNTYHRWVPAFQRVMLQEGNNFNDFYQRCAAIAALPRAERDKLLERLNREPDEQSTATTPQLRKEVPDVSATDHSL